MIDFGKKNLLGVGINAVDYEAAVARLITCAKQGRRCTTSALAVHGVVMGALDPVHRYRLNQLDLVVPDGQPVRWALRWLYGTRLHDRVYGPRLTFRLCREAARQNVPVYFYGSSRTVVGQLRTRMQPLCEGLIVAGAEPSRFRKLSAGEWDSLAASIAESGAKILFVGLGCPRQEVFAYEMGLRLSMPILAVGAAFDYYAGLLREPPEFIQAAGLQWLYRLLQEPRRLFRRYAVTNTQFLALFISQLLGLWKPRTDDAPRPATEVMYG